MAKKLICECGWEGGPYRSPMGAAAAARNHTCEGYRKRKERAERVAAREADPGVKRECRHKQARHQHGTHAAYALDRCRCRPCREAQRQYNAQREKLQAYGRWQPYVDAEPVRAHVRALGEQGMGWKRVTAEASISSGSMSKLMWGRHGNPPSTRVRRATAEALLAVQLHVADGTYVPSIGARRRVQALIALGFPQAYLGRRLGILPSNFKSLLIRNQLKKSTVDAVAALYKELSTADPQAHGISLHSRNRAKNQGRARDWAMPALWEDDELDDPDAQPWTPTTSGMRKKEAEDAALVENVGDLIRFGVTRAAAVRRLGYETEEALYQALRRAQRTDLWKALGQNAENAVFDNRR